MCVRACVYKHTRAHIATWNILSTHKREGRERERERDLKTVCSCARRQNSDNPVLYGRQFRRNIDDVVVTKTT